MNCPSCKRKLRFTEDYDGAFQFKKGKTWLICEHQVIDLNFRREGAPVMQEIEITFCPCGTILHMGFDCIQYEHPDLKGQD